MHLSEFSGKTGLGLVKIEPISASLYDFSCTGPSPSGLANCDTLKVTLRHLQLSVSVAMSARKHGNFVFKLGAGFKVTLPWNFPLSKRKTTALVL